jgi:hypothetical protein
MAYENYTQVAWTPATPITADRLQQMSENTQQVKDATDDNPKGLVKIKEITTSITYNTMNTYHEIINLKNEGGGNPDNSVALPASRYVKITLNFPGIRINQAGQEDSVFILRVSQGNPANTANTVCLWKISQPIHTFLDASTTNPPTTANNHQVRSTSHPSYFGAGSYSIVTTTATGITGSDGSGVFNVEIYRDSGNSAANPSTFIIPCNESKMQLLAEDVGGQG